MEKNAQRNIIDEPADVKDSMDEIADKAMFGEKKPEWKPERRNMKLIKIAAAGVALAVVIAVIIAVVLSQNQGNCETNGATNCATSESDTADTSEAGAGEQKMSMALAAGSVTATIDGKSVTYKGAYVVDGISVEVTAGTFESSGEDEAVFLVVNGGSLKIDGNILVNKTGAENFSGRGDEYSFYGINSAVVVVGEGSSVSVNGATIQTSVGGANVVVATNGGTAVVENTTITTTVNSSRGLHATYGGKINADTVNISTQGGSCAALATDRGAGTVVATNMMLSTAGAGSPLIYSTGDITVTNSKGTATGAQIAVVEGKNSINMQGCDFAATGVGNRKSGESVIDNAGVMIYQSMSGDASVGKGSFTATDTTLSLKSDAADYATTPMFFVTNTEASVTLTGTTLNFSSEAKFMSAMGTSEWGRSGANGGTVSVSLSDVTATNREIYVDDISNVSF